MKKVILSMLVAGTMLSFASCTPSNDDDKPGIEVIDATKQKDQKESFAALKEIQSSLKAKDQTGAELNTIYESKLKSHVAVDVYHASSKEQIRNEFSQFLVNWGSVVAADTEATNGVAGKLENRIVNEKAVEYEQLFKKGMIGSYQLSNALTEAQKAMSPNADKESVLVNVTAYLLGSYESLDMPKEASEVDEGQQAEAYPIYEGNEFAKYLNTVATNPNFSTIADDLYNALKDARTNINDNTKFQNKILEAVSIAQKVVAIRGVHYLLDGSSKIEDASKFSKAIHGLSEGFGFYYSLQFTYNPTTHQAYYTKEDVDTFLNGINLWDTTASKNTCQELAEEIAQKFGFNAADTL